MGTRELADLDTIIRDFLDQLATATEHGWDQTKPAHYRAILAALELALRERDAHLTAWAVAKHDPEPAQVPGSELHAAPLARSERWARRPWSAIVPSGGQ
jgi:hypothetical protein